MTGAAARVEVRPGAERGATRTGWLTSRHSFSYGSYYAPGNTHHGLLVAHNEDELAPGTGFDPHPHRDMEIVTWVLAGQLVHADSAGHRGEVGPGQVQRLSAGTGLRHSEHAGADGARYLQMWVLPDADGRDPGYEISSVDAGEPAGDHLVLASGMAHHGDAVVRIGNRNAALHALRLGPGCSLEVPDAPYLHLFVTTGAVELESVGLLVAGDAARVSGGGGHRVTAAVTPPARAAAELLVWEMHATAPW